MRIDKNVLAGTLLIEDTVSTSAIVQLPRPIQIIFGGCPRRKLRWWKSPFFEVFIRPFLAAWPQTASLEASFQRRQIFVGTRAWVASWMRSALRDPEPVLRGAGLAREHPEEPFERSRRRLLALVVEDEFLCIHAERAAARVSGTAGILPPA